LWAHWGKLTLGSCKKNLGWQHHSGSKCASCNKRNSQGSNLLCNFLVLVKCTPQALTKIDFCVLVPIDAPNPIGHLILEGAPAPQSGSSITQSLGRSMTVREKSGPPWKPIGGCRVLQEVQNHPAHWCLPCYPHGPAPCEGRCSYTAT